MKRVHYLAAELFGYSYDRYQEKMEMGHIRFTKYMPMDTEVLERAKAEGWTAKKVAAALEIEAEGVPRLQERLEEVERVVDAKHPAESFREGVRLSIKYALEKHGGAEQDIEDLVTQICYRTSDLGFLLEEQNRTLQEFSTYLRKE